MAGRLSQDDDDLVETHEINITPFIDVMLVLLIIFMVAAPLSTVDVPVELPVAVAKPQPRPEKPVFVTLQSDQTISVGEAPVGRDALVQQLDLVTQMKRDTRIYLRADKSVPYGALVDVLNAMRGGGYLKVGLVGLDGGGDAFGTVNSGGTARSSGDAP
ncbi:MAG: TonB system transport protein ExbD [Hyphomicrobiaceae bacterium]